MLAFLDVDYVRCRHCIGNVGRSWGDTAILVAKTDVFGLALSRSRGCRLALRLVGSSPTSSVVRGSSQVTVRSLNQR
jgi:hypothetical protein